MINDQVMSTKNIDGTSKQKIEYDINKMEKNVVYVAKMYGEYYGLLKDDNDVVFTLKQVGKDNLYKQEKTYPEKTKKSFTISWQTE